MAGKSKRKWLKALIWVFVGLNLLMVLLLVILQLLLSPKVCTRLVKDYAPNVIVGELGLSSASISLFSHFPAVTIDINDFAVVYPSRYADSTDVLAVSNRLELAGACLPGHEGVRMDTLASFKKFSLSVNVLSLMNGNLRIKNLQFESPRAFIHNYADSTSNLDMIKLSLNEDPEEIDDTSAFILKGLSVKQLFIGSKSNIVFTDENSALYAMMVLKKLDFKGNVSAKDPLADKFSLEVDTLFVAGNNGSDTLMFGLDRFTALNENGKLDMDITAKTYMATRTFGRIKLPIDVSLSCGISDITKGGFSLDVDRLSADVASVHLDANARASFSDSIRVKGRLSVPDLNVQHFIDSYASRIYPPALALRTNATVSAAVEVDGVIDPEMKKLPDLKANVDIPKSAFSIIGVKYEPEIELHATAQSADGGAVNVNLPKLLVDAPGIYADVAAQAHDVLGKDPAVKMDLSLSVTLKELLDRIGKYAGLSGRGNVNATASGSFNLSNLNIYSMDGARITLKARVDDLDLRSPDDSLKIYCHSMEINAGNLKKTGNNAGKRRQGKRKFFAVSASADSLLMRYADRMHLSGKNFSILARSLPEVIKISDTIQYSPLHLNLNMGRFCFEGSDSIRVRLKDSRNNITVRPARRGENVPRLAVNSLNDRVRVKMGHSRLALKGLDFEFSAIMNKDTRKERVTAFRDSIMRRHPDWNEDSLKANFAKRMRARQLPEWLSEKDFRKGDLDFNLGDAFKTYFRQWSVKGGLKLERASLYTPVFPLKTTLSHFGGGFDNDHLSLDSLRLVSGASDLEACGTVSQLRRVLLGHGTPKLRLDICSDTLAINELLSAFAKGQENMEKNMSYLASLDDEKYEAFVAERQARLAASEQQNTALIIVPANIDAEIGLQGNKASYSTLNISSFKAGLKMSRRCVLISDVEAVSDAGTVSLDAFYSTKTKTDLTTGFDLNLKDISAAQIISLIPQVDTIMPLIKSFDGKLNCNLAATASLDTNMNILMPSINGVIRMSGNNLQFKDSKEVEKIARKLLFHNPQSAKVDSMKVEGIIKDNNLEIFPFILKVDRWTIAVAGIQGLDKKYKYHASLIKSPLLFKFGADLYGDDFEDVNFKLGKAKFKKQNDLPSFSTVIDTTRMNLVNNIRHIFEKGVERAVKENDLSLKRERKALKYNHSAALDKLENLSGKEKHFADSLSRSY